MKIKHIWVATTQLYYWSFIYWLCIPIPWLFVWKKSTKPFLQHGDPLLQGHLWILGSHEREPLRQIGIQNFTINFHCEPFLQVGDDLNCPKKLMVIFVLQIARYRKFKVADIVSLNNQCLNWTLSMLRYWLHKYCQDIIRSEFKVWNHHGKPLQNLFRSLAMFPSNSPNTHLTPFVA